MKINPSFGTFMIENVNLNNTGCLQQLQQDLRAIEGIKIQSGEREDTEFLAKGDEEKARELDGQWRSKIDPKTCVLSSYDCYPFITAQPETEKRIGTALAKKGKYDILLLS